LEHVARLFRAAEECFGAASEADARRLGASSGVQARKVLRALRDGATILRRQLETGDRALALRLSRAGSPVGRLISRHTRELLRQYHREGRMSTRIASRSVADEFVVMSPAEARLYEAVEDYIASTYNQAAAQEKTAVGFVMTIYRRRLASSFAALAHTLESRLAAMNDGPPDLWAASEEADEGTDQDANGDVLGPDEVTELERQALAREEQGEIAHLLEEIRRLPPDTKSLRLREELEKLRQAGYTQAMVFTQYTDTMDFLREELVARTALRVLCFSGRGGEVRDSGGAWRTIPRDEAKRLFRGKLADVLLCTDAAAEGLNFQFCGALINYDMPWNPMRVEQRIGRIDRLGQESETIRIVNLHYQDTVETDVYLALRRRINLFESVIGRLQPILATLSRVIAGHVLAPGQRGPDARAALVGELEQETEAAKQGGFDLDAVLLDDTRDVARPPAALSLDDLDAVLRLPRALPPGVTVRPLEAGAYAYQAPGMAQEVRVTTRADYYDAHSGSVELWSPGSPCFPVPEVVAPPEELPPGNLPALLQLANG
jgi:hypothetical protein